MNESNEFSIFSETILAKYADIDRNIKHLEQRLKEGSARDLGQNKVATITEKLAPRSSDEQESKPVQRSVSNFNIISMRPVFN